MIKVSSLAKLKAMHEQLGGNKNGFYLTRLVRGKVSRWHTRNRGFTSLLGSIITRVFSKSVLKPNTNAYILNSEMRCIYEWK